MERIRNKKTNNFLSLPADFQEPSSFDYENGSILIMNKASEPLDILWKNMGLIETQFFFTRFLIFIFCMVIIIFLSTPAVLYSSLQKVDPTNILSMEWANDMGTFEFYIKKLLPPILIIGINLLVLMLLDWASQYECYDSHSAY